MSTSTQEILDWAKLSDSQQEQQRRSSLKFVVIYPDQIPPNQEKVEDNVLSILLAIADARYKSLLEIVRYGGLYDSGNGLNLGLLLNGRTDDRENYGFQVLVPLKDKTFLEELLGEAVVGFLNVRCFPQDHKNDHQGNRLRNANVRSGFVETILSHIERFAIDVDFEPTQEFIARRGLKYGEAGLVIDKIIQMPRRTMKQPSSYAVVCQEPRAN